MIASGKRLRIPGFVAAVSAGPIDTGPAQTACTCKTSPLVLAHPSLPVKSVKELVALARAKPGQLNYDSIGTGSPQHFAGELMKTTFHIQMTHVPYKGAAPALIDVIGGHVPIALVA